MPVPMARRLVWIPVFPSVTVSVALTRAIDALEKATFEPSHAAPNTAAVRVMNSLRFTLLPPGQINLSAGCRLSGFARFKGYSADEFLIHVSSSASASVWKRTARLEWYLSPISR